MFPNKFPRWFWGQSVWRSRNPQLKTQSPLYGTAVPLAPVLTTPRACPAHPPYWIASSSPDWLMSPHLCPVFPSAWNTLLHATHTYTHPNPTWLSPRPSTLSSTGASTETPSPTSCAVLPTWISAPLTCFCPSTYHSWVVSLWHLTVLPAPQPRSWLQHTPST